VQAPHAPPCTCSVVCLHEQCSAHTRIYLHTRLYRTHGRFPPPHPHRASTPYPTPLTHKLSASLTNAVLFTSRGAPGLSALGAHGAAVLLVPAAHLRATRRPSSPTRIYGTFRNNEQGSRGWGCTTSARRCAGGRGEERRGCVPYGGDVLRGVGRVAQCGVLAETCAGGVLMFWDCERCGALLC
jgi:hypothetical protein